MWDDDSNKVYLYKSSYDTEKSYRDEVRRYKDDGWIVKKVEGGSICFRFIHDYEVWKRQK